MRVERNDRATAGSRATTLLLCSLAAMGTGTVASPQTPASVQTSTVVRVEGGELQGVVDDGVASFKGIRFAAPPVGELRWRPPQPAAPWTGVRQAAGFGADCMQGRFGPLPAASAPAPPARTTLAKRALCTCEPKERKTAVKRSPKTAMPHRPARFP